MRCFRKDIKQRTFDEDIKKNYQLSLIYILKVSKNVFQPTTSGLNFIKKPPSGSFAEKPRPLGPAFCLEVECLSTGKTVVSSVMLIVTRRISSEW